MSSVLVEIQQDLTSRLLADPYFSNITVLNEQMQKIEYKIQEAIGKIGVVVILVTPVASIAYPDRIGPYFDEIGIVVRVVEQVTINQGATGIQKPALEIAEHIVAVLHQYKPEMVSEAVTCKNPTITLVPDPNFVSYDIRFRTQAGLDYAVPQIATPAIVKTGSSFTITCATPGAAIFYTVDGTTYPSPRSGTFYTGAFTATSPVKVKCQAWLAGFKPSVYVSQAF